MQLNKIIELSNLAKKQVQDNELKRNLFVDIKEHTDKIFLGIIVRLII